MREYSKMDCHVAVRLEMTGENMTKSYRLLVQGVAVSGRIRVARYETGISSGFQSPVICQQASVLQRAKASRLYADTRFDVAESILHQAEHITLST